MLLSSRTNQQPGNTLRGVWCVHVPVLPGATDGVGYEAARAFAEHGARVIIHGRNEEKARG